MSAVPHGRTAGPAPAVAFTPGIPSVYYERVAPTGPRTGLWVVMVHGGAHTGACYQRTAQGAPGWAYLFARHGYPVAVPDWPGHGRSGMALPEGGLTGEVVAQALSVLVRQFPPPVVLLTHSMGGAFGWRIAEVCAGHLAAVVAVAPGPPGNIQTPAEVVERTDERLVIRAGTGTRTMPLTGMVKPDPNFIMRKLIGDSQRFPRELLPDYVATLGHTDARLVRERANVDRTQLRVADPSRLSGLPVLVVTGTHDPDHAPADDRVIVDWLAGHGARAEHLLLGEHGAVGNGHMVMLEDNSDEVGELLIGWLAACGPAASRDSASPG
jgi:pimeloyl-ACP methyl ester carboxylesterase